MTIPRPTSSGPPRRSLSGATTETVTELGSSSACRSTTLTYDDPYGYDLGSYDGGSPGCGSWSWDDARSRYVWIAAEVGVRPVSLKHPSAADVPYRQSAVLPGSKRAPRQPTRAR
jgi:hypothetical protein